MGISRTRRGAGNLNFIPKLHPARAEGKSMNTKSDHYDVIVIGSGFGGSVAALRATEKGYKVGVLPRVGRDHGLGEPIGQGRAHKLRKIT
jgi:alkyl hydroperoxide reductase subunit AhpF